MPDNVKILISEKNGVELEYQEEHNYHANNQPFDNSSNSFTADSTQMAIEEARDTGVGFAEYETFSSEIEESTTSNNWVVKSGFPFTTVFHTAGEYVIDFTAQLGQSNKQKEVGFSVQWRAGTSGTWITIGESQTGLAADNTWEWRTSFKQVTLPSDNVFQVRIRYGQTDTGGTGRIRNATIKIGRVTS